MHKIWVIALLSGCAVQPQDDGLLDIAEKTPEQIRAEQQQDIESAKEVEDWKNHVCSTTGEERKRLIEETIQKYGWRLVC